MTWWRGHRPPFGRKKYSVRQCEIEHQMDLGMVGLLEDGHWMIEVNLVNMESTSWKLEEYWLLAIKVHRRLLRSHDNVIARLRRNLLRVCINICHQGWMGFSNQSYQGQIVLEGE